MSNMSYCRFQNTLPDLQDCEDALFRISLDDLSEEERHAAEELIKLCRVIADRYEELPDQP